ncbi:hypothetical protein GUITHDRAFT_114387 [Guillardia theta CCMP2712]|uniref:Uncharacterized protein n=1 Tax=Guillardia theta (strain CCMP2712) TaxID=905079 RepID=L1IT68_GUITC|nr:hypothetical protein GUITHDRAFT_114387 [Guillardia theta CCMP2712]EKX39428.1 hypothetical protein GUITHDRAFT_114387 [Guillardia theta CCMP2712]|eukprot:XP_005826408.1 hypothetical protein GUITHDRAFT_114387 [Guillardia theta CCMP2712]
MHVSVPGLHLLSLLGLLSLLSADASTNFEHDQHPSSCAPATSCPDYTAAKKECQSVHDSITTKGSDLASVCQAAASCSSRFQSLYNQYKSTAGCSDPTSSEGVSNMLFDLGFGCLESCTSTCYARSAVLW